MIDEVIAFIWWLIINIILVWTGEIILFIVTLGMHKPRWDLYTKNSPVKFVIFSELSSYVGILFWIGVLCIIFWLLL